MKFPALAPLFTLTLFIFTLLPLPLTLFPSPSYASTDPLPSTLNPIPSSNLHNYTQQVLLDLSSGLVCQLVGIDPSGPDPATGEPKKCLGYDLTGKLGFIPNPAPNGTGQVGGAIGVMGNLIGVLYTPPASSGDYFRYLADNFGLVKPAYAQGIGFQGLKPLLAVWTVLRNVAYVVLVIVFVVIGVLIMLRVKIDPRTVMSIQNQIPKILITLILITFSYAIAGFLIDFMYLMIYFFVNLVVQASPSSLGLSLSQITQDVGGKNVLEVANNLSSNLGIFGLATTITTSVLGVIMNFLGLGGPLGGVVDTSIANILIHTISGVVGGFVGIQIAQIPSPSIAGFSFPAGVPIGIAAGTAATLSTEVLLRTLIPNLIIFLVVFIAILWALFRLWFQLIMAYIFILLDVAFAPLWILTGALPGAGLGFGSWARDILANLSAFPVTIGMFLLGKIFIEGFQKAPTGVVPFVPPLIGNPGDPSVIGALIGLGIILLTPQVVNMVRDAFKAPPFKYAFAIGQALGAGAGIPGGAIKQAAGAIFAFRKGVYPTGAEPGFTAVLRRIFGRF